MSRGFLIASLILFGLFLLACISAAPENVPIQLNCDESVPQNELSSEGDRKTTLGRSGRAEFKGVSFRYDPKRFGEVFVEEAATSPLENETDRPFHTHAQHLLFTFEDIKRSQATSEGIRRNKVTEIQVFPLAAFREAFAVSNDYLTIFENQFSGLRRILSDKDFRMEDEVPLIYFGNGSQELQAKVRHFSFQNGKGVLFVTHWMYEFALISNENLEYVYGGLTEDGKYYVLASMPVSAGFLPETSGEEFEGYRPIYLLEDYPDPYNKKKRYKDYVRRIAKRLEKLRSNQYEPDLKYFEEIISSLKIEK